MTYIVEQKFVEMEDVLSGAMEEKAKPLHADLGKCETV